MYFLFFNYFVNINDLDGFIITSENVVGVDNKKASIERYLEELKKKKKKTKQLLILWEDHVKRFFDDLILVLVLQFFL